MDIPVGKQFGRWTVLGPAVDKHKGSSSYVNCRCSCGTTKDVCLANLKKGRSTIGFIEYQGKQHYFESATDYHFGKFQRDISDPMKREYCQRNEIPLYEIRFDEDTYRAVDSILFDLHVDPVPSLGQSFEEGSTTIQTELAGGETPLREVPHTQNG